jgi:hypothetical protein
MSQSTDVRQKRRALVEIKLMIDAPHEFDALPLAEWLLNDLLRLVRDFPEGHPLKQNVQASAFRPCVFVQWMKEH